MSRRDLVIFSLVLVCAVLVFLVRPRDGERVELREEQGFPSDSGVLVLDTEPVEPVSSYDLGYQQGYLAFLQQQGIEPTGEVSVIYASSHGHGVVGEEDGEMVGRGYMDGYHKASESFGCRACTY